LCRGTEGCVGDIIGEDGRQSAGAKKFVCARYTERVGIYPGLGQTDNVGCDDRFRHRQTSGQPFGQ